MSETKKMGRPKVENPRNKRVEVRFSDKELKELDTLTKRYKLDRASIIRMALEKLK